MSNLEDDHTDNEEFDYNWEYSDDSDEMDQENQYHNSKILKEENNFNAALASFKKVLEIEGSVRGQWGLKALKQIIKINFILNNYDEILIHYKQFLVCIENGALISCNQSEKFIDSIFDSISTIKDKTVIRDFYETTLDTLKKPERLKERFKMELKLGKLYLDCGNFEKLSVLSKELRTSLGLLATNEIFDENRYHSQLLEILALEIQMYTAQKDIKKLKALYELLKTYLPQCYKKFCTKCIPHPLITGIIKECVGKIYLYIGKFDRAYADFFEAFKNYDESGDARRTACFKYLILTNMLMKSDINPFDSPEIKAFRTDAEMVVMKDLHSTYRADDLEKFENILKNHQTTIMDDFLVKEHIQDLLKNIRSRVLTKLVKPYSRIYLSFICKELNMDAREAESLLVQCISDNMVKGRIDQVNEILELERENASGSSRYNAVDKWSSIILSLNKIIIGNNMI